MTEIIVELHVNPVFSTIFRFERPRKMLKKGNSIIARNNIGILVFYLADL